MKSNIASAVILLGTLAVPSSAQPTFDSSGNGLLNGTYYVRQVMYFVQDNSGALGEAISIQGTITFNGTGGYTFSGSVLDSTTGSSAPQTYTSSGTYTISASGLGYISALDPTFQSDQIYGLVSHGIFIGSTTENVSNAFFSPPVGYNDLVVAAPVGSSPATNATLNGSYTVAYIDPTFPGDALFTMNANGKGTIGNISATEYLGTNTTSTVQNFSGVTYSFSNGAAQLNFGGTPNGSTLIAGTELLYISPDGNFVFGGNYSGFDMFVGVRGATSNPSTYDGLYYQAGLDLNEYTVSSGYSLLDSYYGSLQVFSTNIIGHQRENSPLIYGGTSDFTYYDGYTLNGDGSSDDILFGQHYISTADGSIRIGYGIGALLSLNVALLEPPFTGSGVYLDPTGVVNAASSAPFTASVSPGEFLTLYGSGLSSGSATATLPYPPTLNNVQVMINQRPAPIYYVTPTQISVIVPYFTESLAQIQVINNGTPSNIVTSFVNLTSAGVFTSDPVGGIGNAAALHNADFSLISTSSPAQPGEVVALFFAGMGAVNPAVNDGVPAPPSGPISYTTATPFLFLLDSAGNFAEANIAFSGLAPGFAGLYQIDFTVPSGLAAGAASLEVVGPDSDTLESFITLGSGAAAAVQATPEAEHRKFFGHRLPPRRLRSTANTR